MIVEQLSARSFRSHGTLDVTLGDQVTVVTGANGAGKTNLLEALYFGCVGRSCRTRTDTQVISFGESVARVEVEGDDEREHHTLAAAIDRAQGKSFFADGAKVDSFEPFSWRPPVVVFMPDRLELVKGAPGVRRAHLDQLVAALWPARRDHRSRYAQALAQRNALISRGVAESSLESWDREFVRSAAALIADRQQAVDLISAGFAEIAAELGLEPAPELRLRSIGGLDPQDEEAFLVALRERRDDDLRRGFSTFGPHRDELVIRHDGRELRTYGSQGQQRTALLALLLCEGEAILEQTARRPLVLLDDVMSELDTLRRQLLVDRVARLGQVLITATEVDQLPQGPVSMKQLEILDGTVSERV